jgi:hypothetical protein
MRRSPVEYTVIFRHDENGARFRLKDVPTESDDVLWAVINDMRAAAEAIEATIRDR